jgi:hypothetical protein
LLTRDESDVATIRRLIAQTPFPLFQELSEKELAILLADLRVQELLPVRAARLKLVIALPRRAGMIDIADGLRTDAGRPAHGVQLDTTAGVMP